MKPPFQFQQFTIRDDRCAMKVGTDAVLLGAWAPIRGAKTILDVGTGCGIIALMLAQRTADLDSQISAIDVDAEASSQAAENFADSPWPNRLPGRSTDVHFSLSGFAQCENCDLPKFDLIVSNPPFFESATPSPESTRNVARHTANTARSDLLQSMHGLLEVNGRFCLVLPFEQVDSTIELTSQLGMRLLSRTDVRPNPQSNLKRVLLEFGNTDSFCALDIDHVELVVELSRHQYTDQYAALTREFHLRYANPK